MGRQADMGTGRKKGAIPRPDVILAIGVPLGLLRLLWLRGMVMASWPMCQGGSVVN